MPTDVSGLLREQSYEDLIRELDAARTTHWEDAAGSLETAIRCSEAAGGLGHDELRGRALALQGAVTLNRGDLQGALALATQAARFVAGNDAARCELASLKSQLSFFSGSYNEAMEQAEEAIAIADASGDAGLRIFARRAGCMILGNAGVAHLYDHLIEVLELSVAAGDRWQEAMSRNDLACWHAEQGDAEAAAEQLDLGLEIARELEPNAFALGVLQSTRSDIRLLAGRAEEALADARGAIASLTSQGAPNPYVFGVTVRAEVQALAALGRLDEAQDSSEGALVRLGEQVPHARAQVLATIAEALREAGRIEDAYDALSRSAELEREGLRQLSELRVSLERATIETRAARNENARLAALVAELDAARAALEARTAELEALKEQFREQADRDWLTGLHNRRYLARRLEDSGQAFSMAVLDLDHFKSVNDDHGHEAGDQVLVRVAELLLSVVRHSDVVARTGGEEFVLLMPRTDLPAAVRCCERALSAIRGACWSDVAPGLRVTASIGIAGADEGMEFDAIAALADSRLYAAKRAGRDRVIWDG
jgi:diguanylate cyclase (GGDEF)-like protein